MSGGTPMPRPTQSEWDAQLDTLAAEAQVAADGGNKMAQAALEEIKRLKAIDPATLPEPEKLPKGKRLDELVEAGKPLLLESGSEGAALSLAKEAAIMLDDERDPSIIDIDKVITPDTDSFNAEWAASGPIVIVSEPMRATPEVRRRVAEVMDDPTKRVIVCGGVGDPKKPMTGLTPDLFTAKGGHFVRF